MNRKTTAHKEEGLFQKYLYICLVKRHIYLDIRKCPVLFSHVKSGKFWDENKIKPHHDNIMAWAVVYFSPRVYQSLHDKITIVPRFLFSPSGIGINLTLSNY